MGLPPRLLLAKSLLRNWPFPKGKGIIHRLLLKDESIWPDTASFDFKYGRFIDAGLLPWPLGYRELYLNGVMDMAETRIWRTLLRDGDTVVDGGANLGYFTLLASRMVGPSGHVLAYEPVSETAGSLRRNIEASRCANVTVLKAALSDRNGVVKLNICDRDPFLGKASMGKYENQNWIGEENCLCVALDGLFECNIRPALIKLDIEGAEPLALKGASKLLQRRNPPAITFEWNEDAASGLNCHPSQALELLGDFGYTPFLAGKSGFVPFSVRHDIEEWIPMVWCFKRGEMWERAVASKLL